VKIADMIYQFANSNPATVKSIREKAAVIAEKALWKHFIRHYAEAYDYAIIGTKNGKRKTESK